MSNKENFTFSWKLNNFSLWQIKDEEHIRSPDFAIECLDNSKWHVLLYPKHREVRWCMENSDSYLQDKQITLSATIEIFTVHNKILASTTTELTLQKYAIISGIIYPIEKDFNFSKIKNCPRDILILRLHLRIKNKDENVHVKWEAETNFVAKQYIAMWNKGQCLSVENTSEYVTFPLLQCPLKLCFNKDEDSVTIGIRLMSSYSGSTFLVNGTISILDKMKIKQKSQFDSYTFQSASQIWYFPKFISKNELDTTEYFKLIFHVPTGEVENIIKAYTYQAFETKEFPPNKDVPNSLMKDINSMLTSKKYSDVKLRVEDELIDAHKFILAARSPLFCTMIDQNMMENRSGIIDILDLDVETVESLLQYMYTDSVKITDFARSLKLLMAAHKYQILSLVNECASFLTSILDVDNIFDIVRAADMTGHEFLKNAAINFINANAKAIMPMPKWITFFKSNVELGSEIVCKLSMEIAKSYQK